MTFDDLLRNEHAGADVLLEAARLQLAETEGYPAVSSMRERLVAATGSEERVDDGLKWLTDHPDRMEDAARRFLEERWSQPERRESVESVIADAAESMPALELGVIAIAVMYIAWLRHTDGVQEKSEKETKTRLPNGAETSSRETKTTYWSPEGPLSAIVKLFSGAPPKHGDDS